MLLTVCWTLVKSTFDAPPWHSLAGTHLVASAHMVPPDPGAKLVTTPRPFTRVVFPETGSIRRTCPVTLPSPPGTDLSVETQTLPRLSRASAAPRPARSAMRRPSDGPDGVICQTAARRPKTFSRTKKSSVPPDTGSTPDA